MITQYTPKSIAMVFNSIPLLGYGDAEFVNIARAGDMWEIQKGAGGDTCRIELTDDSAIATVTLLAGGPTNARLSALAKLDKLTKRGIGEWQLEDLLGTTLVHAEKAWIMSMPDITYGKDGPQREWRFCLADCDTFAGGSVL